MIIGEMIPRNGVLRRDLPAIIHDGGQLSFGQYAERSYRLANALTGAGAAHQDRISILARNCVEYLEVCGAGETTGLVVHPINFRLTAPEIAYLLNDAEPSVVFYEAEFETVIAANREGQDGILRYVRIGGDGAGLPEWAVDYETFLNAGTPERVDMRPSSDDTAYLFYSSGSTGRPKGVMLGQSAQWHIALTVGYELGLTPCDIGLLVMPLFHIGGRFSQIAHHLIGAPIHVVRRFDAAQTVDMIEREAITTLHLAPTMIQSILDLADIDKRNLSSLRTLGYGASAMPVALLRQALERFGPILVQRYGSTEAAVVSYLDKQDHLPDGTPAEAARLASAGKPGPMAEISVRRADGGECEVGEAGEIHVHNPALVMQGYWRNAEASREVLRDGWCDLGDVGYFDEDGFLFIIDRKTEMIISGGENIYPREVEEALMHHPEVADAAVIGVPDEHWGQSVLAFVVARDGSAPEEAQIIEFCQSRIASYKKPSRVEFTESLPRASTGKIDKVALREPYWRGLERKV